MLNLVLGAITGALILIGVHLTNIRDELRRLNDHYDQGGTNNA